MLERAQRPKAAPAGACVHTATPTVARATHCSPVLSHETAVGAPGAAGLVGVCNAWLTHLRLPR